MVTDQRKHKPKHMTAKKIVEHTTEKSDAILFLAQLKRHEEQLIEEMKQLEKTDKAYLERVLSTEVDGWTPFHAFVLRGARKLVKISLRCGVDANLAMGRPDSLPGGLTPLHLAAYRGDVSIIEVLLQYDADVQKKDWSEHAPVYYAATYQNTLAARKLLKQGADITDLDKDQREFYEKRRQRRTTTFLCIKSTFF